MLLTALALTLAVPASQRAPKPGPPIRMATKRIVWLPTTAAYASADPALRPDWACNGMDAGLTSVKTPYSTVKMADVKAAVQAMDLKTAGGGSPVGSDENWSPEGALKVAMKFKADYYGMVKLTKAFHQDDATGKYVELQCRMSLYDANGKAVKENVPLRTRDATTGGKSGSVGQATEAAFSIGKTLVPDWYKANVAKAK